MLIDQSSNPREDGAVWRIEMHIGFRAKSINIGTWISGAVCDTEKSVGLYIDRMKVMIAWPVTSDGS